MPRKPTRLITKRPKRKAAAKSAAPRPLELHVGRQPIAVRETATKLTLHREALRQRIDKIVREIVESAPDSAVVTALAQPTALRTLAEAMTSSVHAEGELADADKVLAAAIAAGASYKQDLLERAGGAYSADQLAKMLDRTRQAVNEGRSRNRYFGVPTTDDAFAYPKCQLTSAGLLSGLREFLDAFDVQDPWTQLMVLLEPSDRLKGETPLDALRAGHVEQATQVAGAYGQHGA